MKGKLNLVLKEALEKVSPPKEDLIFIDESLKLFLLNVKKRIKKLSIDVEVFVGGSYAKKTLTKSKFYDVDIFLRFGKKYREEDYSKLSEKILKGIKNVTKAHGSRDYFRIKLSKNVFFEVVPVKKVKNPKEALNITDLSYSHVKYINKKIKNQKILDAIKLGKAFLKSSKVYGAESYVHGFSGYSVELLIYYFGSFEKFLKELSLKRKEKLIIDLEKLYKKGNVLMDMNGSKLDSPVVLVDPTFKGRNVLAALTSDSYERFQNFAIKFLKNPTTEFFEVKEIDFKKIQNEAEKKGFEFLKVKMETKKEEGDVAGTKLLKFFNHLSRELERYFEVKNKEFEYSGKKDGEGYFVLKPRKEIILNGPKADDKKNVDKFKKEHKNIFEKKGRIFARKKVNFSSQEFLKNWLIKNNRKVKEMYVSKVEVF